MTDDIVDTSRSLFLNCEVTATIWCPDRATATSVTLRLRQRSRTCSTWWSSGPQRHRKDWVSHLSISDIWCPPLTAERNPHLSISRSERQRLWQKQRPTYSKHSLIIDLWASLTGHIAAGWCRWLAMNSGKSFHHTPLMSSAGVMPKHGLDVGACEVFRFYKLVTLKGLIEPISMIVPRRVSQWTREGNQVIWFSD